jgi:hypothetical protein
MMIRPLVISGSSSNSNAGNWILKYARAPGSWGCERG